MRRNRNIRDRGFSLIELMIVSALALIVLGSVFGAMIAQQTAYVLQLEATETSQNARAALDILRHELRMAGWGITGNEAAALPAVGTCNSSDRFDCNNEQEASGSTTDLSDRLRVFAMEPARYDSNSNRQPGNSMLRTHKKNIYAESEAPGIPVGGYAILDGTCSATGAPSVMVIQINNDVNDGQYWHKYQFAAISTLGGDSCTAVDDGFKLSGASISDFYVDRNEDTPRLMLHQNPGSLDSGGALVQPKVVAFGIDGLHIQYGVDTGRRVDDATPDNLVDVWCDALATCDLSAATVQTYSASQLAARTIALRLAVVASASQKTGVLTSANVDPQLTIFDRSYDASTKVRRRIYRSTVRLRNNEL